MSLEKLKSLQESPALVLLISLTLIVPLIWWLLLGWRTSYLLSQQDNLQLIYPFLRDLIRAGGDWQQLGYWTGLQGGVKVHDVIGSMPVSQLLAFLGFTPLAISNLTLFFIQILFAYFCSISVLRLANIAFNNIDPVSVVVIVMVGLIFAFLPVLGWRLTYGHGNILCGMFVFLCMNALLLEEMTGTRSLVTCLLSVLGLTHAFQSNGYQMVYYSLLLGGPIILAVLVAIPGISVRQRARYLFVPLVIFLAALLLSLTKFSGIAANFVGGDMARTVDSGVIYSYTTATLNDWISSIPWSTDYMTNERHEGTRHEVNYPIGPMVLALFLAGLGKVSLRLFVGIGISLSLALVISTNITPLSTLLVDFVPMLKSFRVPARSIMPVLIFTSIFSSAILVAIFSRARGEVQIRLYPVMLILVAVTSFNFSYMNDLLLCFVLLLIGISVYMKIERKELVLVGFALFLGSAISAFHERINLPASNPISEAVTQPIKNAILSNAPELEDPLHRAYLKFRLYSMGNNSAYYIGISTLTGYWFALGRFGELNAALNRYEYRSTVSVFDIPPNFLSYRPLSWLYNVGRVVEYQDGEIKVSTLSPTLGPAWLSGDLLTRESIAEVASSLLEDSTIDKRRWQALINMNDPVNSGFDINRIQCESATLISSRTNLKSVATSIEIKLVNKGTCLLTIATSFAGNLKAYNEEGAPLETLVTYGSLLAVVVPDHTHRINIVAEAWVPLWSKIALYLGWLLIALLIIFYLFNRQGFFPLGPGVCRTQR